MKPKKENLLSVQDTVADSQNKDYTGKVVVINPTILKDEYRNAQNQLWLVTHGPGCRDSHSFTGTVHLTHITDGDSLCIHRNDILGIAKPSIIQPYLEQAEQEIAAPKWEQTM